MPNYCCVRELHTISKTIFKVPQNEDMKKKWEEVLGFTIKKSYHICATHFEDSDIISKWESGQESNKYTICLKRLHLKKGAIPVPCKKKIYAQSLESIKDSELNKACTSSLDSTLHLPHTDSLNSFNLSSPNIDLIKHDHLYCIQTSSPKKRKTDVMMVNSVFQLIYQNIQTIHLPNNWYCNKSIEYIEYEPVIAFHKLSAFKPHPNNTLYKILETLEVCFIKHAASLNPFEDTYEEFFQMNDSKLTFPCGLHKTDMLTDIFVTYITMRMRQFSYLNNQDVKKVNKCKKKVSKLVHT